MSIITVNEDGLRNNIKHLEDIISIKVTMLSFLSYYSLLIFKTQNYINC